MRRRGDIAGFRRGLAYALTLALLALTPAFAFAQEPSAAGSDSSFHDDSAPATGVLTDAFSADSAPAETVSARPAEPMFSIFKENFITTGFPLNLRPEYDTSDLAYQVSMRFNAFQDICGSDWDCFAGYTQMSLWDVYAPSNPFRCHTYTFGLYAYHPLSYDGGEVTSDILTGYEHRSNGLRSHDSRDLNYIFACYTRALSRNVSIQAMARFGASSIGNEVTLRMYGKYQGYASFTGLFTAPGRQFEALLSVAPLFGSDIPANVTAELAFKPVKHSDWFWLTARYHFGYDENQLECESEGVVLRHMVRFGISLQPRLRSYRMMP